MKRIISAIVFSSAFLASCSFVSNIELRTVPVQIMSYPGRFTRPDRGVVNSVIVHNGNERKVRITLLCGTEHAQVDIGPGQFVSLVVTSDEDNVDANCSISDRMFLE